MESSQSAAIRKPTLMDSIKSGTVCGLNAEWPAIYLGFVLHMITGAIIGIVYMIISDRVRQLRTDSTSKTVGTGISTGIVVWAVLFIPLHSFIISPTLQNMLLTSPVGSTMHLLAERLIQMSDSILYGALAIHFVFGAVLGFIARIATSSRDTIEKEAEAETPHDKNDDASLTSNA